MEVILNNSKESRLVKRAIKKYKWDILKVWTLKILFLITSLSSMYISGLYINVLVTGVNWNLILKYMLVLAGLIIWEIMFNYWNVMRYYQTQANLVFYINYYVLKHIKRIRLSFFDDKDPAYLNQRVNEDINSIVNYKLDLICNMSISVLSFITIIGILSRVEWKLAVITILSISRNSFSVSAGYPQSRNRFITSCSDANGSPSSSFSPMVIPDGVTRLSSYKRIQYRSGKKM